MFNSRANKNSMKNYHSLNAAKSVQVNKSSKGYISNISISRTNKAKQGNNNINHINISNVYECKSPQIYKNFSYKNNESEVNKNVYIRKSFCGNKISNMFAINNNSMENNSTIKINKYSNRIKNNSTKKKQKSYSQKNIHSHKIEKINNNLNNNYFMNVKKFSLSKNKGNINIYLNLTNSINKKQCNNLTQLTNNCNNFNSNIMNNYMTIINNSGNSHNSCKLNFPRSKTKAKKPITLNIFNVDKKLKDKDKFISNLQMQLIQSKQINNNNSHCNSNNNNKLNHSNQSNINIYSTYNNYSIYNKGSFVDVNSINNLNSVNNINNSSLSKDNPFLLLQNSYDKEEKDVFRQNNSKNKAKIKGRKFPISLTINKNNVINCPGAVNFSSGFSVFSPNMRRSKGGASETKRKKKVKIEGGEEGKKGMSSLLTFLNPKNSSDFHLPQKANPKLNKTTDKIHSNLVRCFSSNFNSSTINISNKLIQKLYASNRNKTQRNRNSFLVKNSLNKRDKKGSKNSKKLSKESKISSFSNLHIKREIKTAINSPSNLHKPYIKLNYSTVEVNDSEDNERRAKFTFDNLLVKCELLKTHGYELLNKYMDLHNYLIAIKEKNNKN